MTDASITLDAAALDRWAALLARITDHSDGMRQFAEVYDDDLSAFVAQSRLALTQAERIATLEAELSAIRLHEGVMVCDLLNSQAHANALRDALLRIQIGCGCGCDDFAAKALAQAPAASLAAAKDSLRSHDAEVLERAAVKCDEIVRGHSPENARVGTGRRHETKMLAAGAKMCAGAIRALAAQEVKP